MSAFILNLVFIYPFIMSIIWTGAALSFFLRQEKKPMRRTSERPFVSILVPCYNEEETIAETIKFLSTEVEYSNYEIIAINDGSKDNTIGVLRELIESKKYQRLRVVNLERNAGKAHALTQGAIAAKGEFLFGVDADSFLEHDAIDYMISHFLGGAGKRVGAVTGNPIVRNRSTLLARIQLAEYASIIGLIKRAQRVYGRINTVSGVCVMFRKRALMEVGFWDQDMITEDISITWKLQEKNWHVRYEPNAICWMLVPETLRGLWIQRVRWAQGGHEVLFRHIRILFNPKAYMLLPVLLEQLISTIWVFLWFYSIFLFFYRWIFLKEFLWESILIGMGLVVVCIIQFAISLLMIRRYDKTAIKYLFWAGWYPFIYWILNPVYVIAALPRAINKTMKGGQAVWNSPDRGLGRRDQT